MAVPFHTKIEASVTYFVSYICANLWKPAVVDAPVISKTFSSGDSLRSPIQVKTEESGIYLVSYI